MTTVTRFPIPAIAPISIAIDKLKIGDRSKTLKASGIDLDSGRRISLALKTEGPGGSYVPASPDGCLVLVISIERLTLD